VQPLHLHVLGHDGDAAGVEGAQVGVWRAQHKFATTQVSPCSVDSEEPRDPYSAA
jgi:hypothetical protein